MDRIYIKTLAFALLVGVLIAVSYVFFDRPAAMAAWALRNTGWHVLAKDLSQCANHFFFSVLLAMGFICAGYDGLKNGLTRRSKSILYICTTVACAMIVGDVFKEVCGRARPQLLFEKDVYGFFPMVGNYLHFSFPSGHTLRIFSSMTALGLVVPRWRVPGLTLALLVGVSRVVALKHYPSDVLFGAFIGITVAVWGWRLLYPYGKVEASWGSAV